MYYNFGTQELETTEQQTTRIIMAYINDYAYYRKFREQRLTNANWGSYQYVSLADIVNNFMLMYQGNHELDKQH